VSQSPSEKPARVTIPFPPAPSASKAGRTLTESVHVRREPARHLPAGAPNVLIILLDDAGFGQADTVGGEIHTPTLTRIADSGLRYNAFHTTAVSSSTRAALLTGRNHHRVGNGTITEFASDFDGYVGEIPASAATAAEVLKGYGYRTAAFGKWHNTPVQQTGPVGPFDNWPTGRGFEYFYGFNGAETDQYSPSLFRNTTSVEPPRNGGYHLTEDLAADAVRWLREHRLHAPDKPFFMYWAPGAVHGPHQVSQEWSDRYKGRFDEGWDAYRQRVFERQKAMGWIPADTELTPRPSDLPAWESLSSEERKFQARLMEVYAGFLEHTDTQAGHLIDELERQGIRDNTIVIYVFSDNGASSEGKQGTITEMISINGLQIPAAQQMQALEKLYGGLEALGGPKLTAMYHAAWAWASQSPFFGTKLVAGYFGGTRVPLAISWPRAIQADPRVRRQFHHVNDIVPTLYDLIGVSAPTSVNGVEQDPLDGTSMRYTFADAEGDIRGRKRTQYFEIFGGRGIYDDGWMASALGPYVPWGPGWPDLSKWNPDRDAWALFDLTRDYSQAHDLAAAEPARLAELIRRFDAEAEANGVYPLGAGLFPLMYPAQRVGTTRTEWHFDSATRRLPEFMAPNLRSRNSVVTVEFDAADHANGVLYSLGTVAAGVALFVIDGQMRYEYNLLGLMRIKLAAPVRLVAGRHRVEVETRMAAPRPGAPAQLTLRLDGETVAGATTPFTPPLVFSATGTFNVGSNAGSPISLDYFGAAPFSYDGVIHDVHVLYTD
jgi:arylsulfatase A-like enzyme